LHSRALGITVVNPKRQIGSHDDGGLLGPFGNYLEQKLSAVSASEA